jgi:hypothetical protein
MDFSRPDIKFKRDGIEVFLIKACEVGTLGQVLAQQAVGGLIATSLLRAMRISKVDLHAGSLG